jgi:hypothetical protein
VAAEIGQFFLDEEIFNNFSGSDLPTTKATQRIAKIANILRLMLLVVFLLFMEA